MNYSINETMVRFVSNKPNLLKKIIIFSLIFAYLAYVAISKGIKNSIWEFVFVIFSFSLSLTLISLRSKVKNPIKLIKMFFKSMSKKKILDVLPIDISIDEKQMKIKIKSAEYFHKKVIDETFTFEKDKIAEITYSPLDGFINIKANKVLVELEGKDYRKETENSKTDIYFYLQEQGEEIYKKLIDCGYAVINAKTETEKEKDYQKNRKADVMAKRKEREKAEEDKNVIERKVSEIQKKNPELTTSIDDMINGFDSETEKREF